MELRLKFMGILVFLIVFTFAFSSLPCSQVFAQDKIGKSAAQRPSVFKPLVTFVEIGAARCIPCKAMQPIMKEVAEEYRGQVRVLFHDVWTPQGRMDAEKYNIRVDSHAGFSGQGRQGVFPTRRILPEGWRGQGDQDAGDQINAG